MPWIWKKVLISAALTAVFLPQAAHAFCRTATGGADTCTVQDATPLSWESPRITMSIAFDTCTKIDDAALRFAILKSFAAWEEAGGGCSSITFIEGSESLAFDTNLDGLGIDRVNRIRCREDAWPDISGVTVNALNGNNLVAHTSVRHDPVTGNIIDADVDLNLVDFEWSSEGEDGKVDIQNAMVHELGHVLGFAHTQSEAATMFASALPGETLKRDLAEDDITGACEVFPFSLLGDDTDDREKLKVRGGIGCQVGSTNEVAGLLAPLALLLLTSLRRWIFQTLA